MSDPRLTRALEETAARLDTGAHAVTLGEVRTRARSIRRRRSAAVAAAVAVLAVLPFSFGVLDPPRSEPAQDPQKPVRVLLDVDAPIDDTVPEPYVRDGQELHVAGETIELDRDYYDVRTFGDGFIGIEAADGLDLFTVLDSGGDVVSRTPYRNTFALSDDHEEAAFLGQYGTLEYLTTGAPRPRTVIRPGGAEATTIVGVRDGRILFGLRGGGASWVDVDSAARTQVPIRTDRDRVVAVLPDGSLLWEHSSGPVTRNQNCVYRTVEQRQVWQRCGVTVPPTAVSPDGRHVLVTGYYASPESLQVLRIADGTTVTSASMPESRDQYFRFLVGPWYDDARVRVDVYVDDPDSVPGDRGIVLTVVGEGRGTQRSVQGVAGGGSFSDEPIPGPIEAP